MNSYSPPVQIITQACAGKDVNEADHRGDTALGAAVNFNWQEGVSQLLAMKADVNKVNLKKEHPLHYAVQHGPEMMKLLIDAKADLNCQNEDPDFDDNFTSKTFGNRTIHRTPLHMACGAGDEAAASFLLTSGAKIDV